MNLSGIWSKCSEGIAVACNRVWQWVWFLFLSLLSIVVISHIREAKLDFLPSWLAGSHIILDYSPFYFMSLPPFALRAITSKSFVYMEFSQCVWEFRWSHCLEGVEKCVMGCGRKYM